MKGISFLFNEGFIEGSEVEIESGAKVFLREEGKVNGRVVNKEELRFGRVVEGNVDGSAVDVNGGHNSEDVLIGG